MDTVERLIERYTKACQMLCVDKPAIVEALGRWWKALGSGPLEILFVDSASARAIDRAIDRARARAIDRASARAIAIAIDRARTSASASARAIAIAIDRASASASASAIDRASAIAIAIDRASARASASAIDRARIDWWYESRYPLYAAYAGNQAVYDQWEPALAAFEAGAYCWWVWSAGVILVLPVPAQISWDANRRLHNESGPALTWLGEHSYMWHGVRVSRNTIEHPELITVQQINGTTNVEEQRVLLGRYGEGRYLEDSGARVISEDAFGILYRQNFAGDEPLVMLKVANSTPEADGTRKGYFLRVPPNMRTAHEAAAWTFGFDAANYQPLQET